MNDTARKILGEKLHQIRVSKGMTLEKVSMISKLNKGHLSEIENGKVSVKLDTLDNMIQVLNVDHSILYASYLDLITSSDACLHFISHCLKRNDEDMAERGLQKLFSITGHSRISTKSVDFIIVFFDK